MIQWQEEKDITGFPYYKAITGEIPIDITIFPTKDGYSINFLVGKYFTARREAPTLEEAKESANYWVVHNLINPLQNLILQEEKNELLGEENE